MKNNNYFLYLFTKKVLLIVLVTFVSCVKPTARKPVSHHSSSYMATSVVLNKKINSLQEKAIKYYISKDSLNTYYTSPNGFWYKYNYQIKEDKKTPIIGNEVFFEYEIVSLSDKILYSKEILGKNRFLIDREDIESGLQNGLKLMKEGEEITFIFPSFKAFGYSGNQDKINSNQPLIYKVKLNKINKLNKIQ